MSKRPNAEFFIKEYFKEHPAEHKKVTSGKMPCPFSESSITGMSKRYRHKELPKEVQKDVKKAFKEV